MFALRFNSKICFSNLWPDTTAMFYDGRL